MCFLNGTKGRGERALGVDEQGGFIGQSGFRPKADTGQVGEMLQRQPRLLPFAPTLRPDLVLVLEIQICFLICPTLIKL